MTHRKLKRIPKVQPTVYYSHKKGGYFWSDTHKRLEPTENILVGVCLTWSLVIFLLVMMLTH